MKIGRLEIKLHPLPKRTSLKQKVSQLSMDFAEYDSKVKALYKNDEVLNEITDSIKKQIKIFVEDYKTVSGRVNNMEKAMMEMTKALDKITRKK